MVLSHPCHTPLGQLILYEREGALVMVGFSEDDFRPDSCQKETHLLREGAKQLGEYFAGERKVFTLPLAPRGSAFYRKVWDTMIREIPYGETRSYGEVALMAGYPRAARAVGTANRHCPISIFIPCHRVIGAGGKLGGYGDLSTKRFLLDLEAAHK